MIKLSDTITPKFQRSDTNWKYNAANHCLGLRPTGHQSFYLTVGITNLSLANETDRRRIKRVAREMIRLCNVALCAD